MSLNEEPNTPDPIFRAFQELVDACYPMPRPTPNELAASQAVGDLREALEALDRELSELLMLIAEFRRVRRPDDFRPFA